MIGENITSLQEMFEKFEENESWFSTHFEEFEEKYRDVFVAVKDQKIIAIDKKLENLLEQLETRGEDISSVFITAIPPKGVASIL